MRKLPDQPSSNPQPQTGAVAETSSTQPMKSSKPSTAAVPSEASTKATEMLFGWCRMPDVAEPRIYLAGCAAILDDYPQAVRDQLADPRSGTRLLKPFPSLHDIREACDKAYEPIERALLRERAAESHRLALAAPAKPDQATRDAQVADYETRIKPVLTAALKPIPAAPVERGDDGRHALRIAGELAARKARNEQAQSSTDPPPKESAA